MPGCRDVSTHIEEWMKRALSPEITERTSHRFPLQLSFGMTMEVFISGRCLEQRVNTKNDRYLSWSGRTRTSDTFDVIETCFLRNRFGTLRNLQSR